MKVTVEIECTPEEARRTMGLPDLAPVQERYVAELAAMMQGQVTPEAVEVMFRNWAPLGETGMGLWRALLNASERKS